MDILSSGYLRSVLCLIGTTIVQMFSKKKALTYYQGNKWLHSRQSYEEFKSQNEPWIMQNIRKLIISESPLMLKQFNGRWVLQMVCFLLVTLLQAVCQRSLTSQKRCVLLTEKASKASKKPKQNPLLNTQVLVSEPYRELLPTSPHSFSPSHFWFKFLQ